ncbi:hypothetical protein IJX73_03790 [bacterium]|nr:hypothetical protein [bacterium]MBQ9150033.1 hypothetical protein [bacterium]
MKIKAWTMAELAVSMLILIVLSYASITVTKVNGNNQAKIFTYAMMKNLSYGHGSISDKYGEFYPEDADETSGDWYCKNLADIFALSNTPSCATTTAVFKFANGVKIEGLSRAWVAPYTYKADSCIDEKHCKEEPDFWYKNILLDVNGDSNPNKIGVDRIPLRIYRGFTALGGDISGLVVPACGTYDYTYDPTGAIKYLNSGSYCADSINLIENNELISYNIYRADDVLEGMKDWSSGDMKDKTTTASLVAGSISYMEADCKAYGGNGFFNKIQCYQAGYKLHENCANHDICKDCNGTLYGTTYNVCPTSYASNEACATRANTLNDKDGPDQSCFVLLNRPTQGLGFMAGALMGDIDM